VAGDIFARIGDIKGESQDARHKDEIDVISWSWGVTQAGAPATSRGGGGAGKATFSDLAFVHKLDKASPNLFKTCATGTHIPEAVMTARKAGGGQHEYLIVKMSDVLITSVQTLVSGGDVSETVALTFAKVELEYRPQRPDGSADTGVSFKYDLKQNRTF
jgi:type VI secretion system secreted protein Hcp